MQKPFPPALTRDAGTLPGPLAPSPWSEWEREQGLGQGYHARAQAHRRSKAKLAMWCYALAK